MTEFFSLMKFELVITAIIFILLFMKLAKGERSNESTLNVVNVLLLVSFAFGFIWNNDGMLFNGMFRTTHSMELQKNILNLGTVIISFQAFHWLKNHRHVLEFYMLLLCTLLGMFFMISSGNLLMFWLGLELSTIPLAALC